MKNKINLLTAFIIVALSAYGAPKVPLLDEVNSSKLNSKTDKKDEAFLGTDELEIDLINNTLTSKDGINIKQGNMELKAFDFKRDVEKNKVFVNKKLQALFVNETGDLTLESLDGGEVTLDGSQGIFYNNFAYLNVGKVTGAERPNENIYFGGEKIIYKDEIISIDNGWFTTDYKIKETKNPHDAGYNLLSKNIKIEPDKQVTFVGTDFYNGDKKRTPYPFPWFRMNIRKDSEVPLFPQWGTSEYYGWQTSVGALYGNKGDKFVGGLAPKFADRMGLLVGRWENWYKTDNFGTAKLNIDDWLIWKKENKNSELAKLANAQVKDKDEKAKQDRDKKEYIDNLERSGRYKFNFTHQYDAEKGKFNLDMTRATYNMVPKLEDVIKESIERDKFRDNKTKTVNTPELDHSIGFYSLDADLKDLGENKDITIKSKFKLTSDKNIYGLMVYDDIDDISYGSSIDNDLYSSVEAYKDNKNYKIGGYYRYLYDMDPGSTFTDTQSRAEDFGFSFLDKDTKIGFAYDETNGDKLRKLALWERNPKEDPEVSYGAYGDNFKYNYTPSMVKEYDNLRSKSLKISLGEYEVANGYKVKPGYDYSSERKLLNLTDDTSRNNVKNPRSKQYNRFENIVYRDFEEERGYIDFFDDTTKFTVAGGTTKDEIWNRDGIYSKDGYKGYLNDSTFYEFEARKNEISLGKFGDLGVFTGIRYDKYKKGEDSSTRGQFGLNHIATLYNNENKKDRKIDFAVANDIKLFYQKYNYGSGKNKALRLENKEDIYQVVDSITGDIGNTSTTYTIDYKRGENPVTKELKNEVIKNRIDFKVDDEKTLEFNTMQDKRYTNKTLSDKNYNNYTFGEYGVKYYIGKHMLSYGYNTVDSKIWDIDTRIPANKGLTSIELQDAKEEIRLNKYAYGYNRDNFRFGLDYAEGTVRRNRIPKVGKVVDELEIENRIYGVSLAHGKEDVLHTYRGTYETYKNKNSSMITVNNEKYNSHNSDIISFNYEYQNKRFDDSDLRGYGALEFDKSRDTLTREEIDRIRDILRTRDRNHIDFKLNNNNYTKLEDMGDYKYNFKFNIMMEKNEARYKLTHDYLQSLEEIELGLLYSQNRFGIGYNVKETAGWTTYKNKPHWRKTEREHKVSLLARIGKPSEGWTLKTYAKFYEDLEDRLRDKKPEDKGRKNSLDGLGVELGKEMGYYKWAVAFEREYVAGVRDYQWKAALQFTLLTFPENPIFGLGGNTKTNKHTQPKTYLFNGLKVNDIID